MSEQVTRKQKRVAGTKSTYAKNAKRVSISEPLMLAYVQITRSRDYIYRNTGDPERMERGYERLMKTLARDYLPALELLKEKHSTEVLQAAHDELYDRLMNGMDAPPAPKDDPSTDNIMRTSNAQDHGYAGE